MEKNYNAGGPANTPPFSPEPTAVRTAADHQLPDETGGGTFGTGGSSGLGGGSGTAGSSGSAGGQGEQLREKAKQTAGQLEGRVNEGMQAAAGRLETAADQLGRMADDKLGGGEGVKARAGEMAHTTADTLDSFAGYLRNNDFESLRSDLERQMRERPLQTLLIGVAAGWVVGKILR